MIRVLTAFNAGILIFSSAKPSKKLEEHDNEVENKSKKISNVLIPKK